ncbi:Hydroxymethylglutaryl-CoA lyase, mitochondrial [Tolypocladium paradoxum]|uniref:Hydroxymethylglutaryl-CoA lyase, mitochondrial n=1 Tax=Tolypocladium paradoxum TaxID=94208 RepID=A0A2S4L8T2_9HYPO|nr:Hydroxymethylglutaryl-CoA lyase, mitochondrial [Tolypocladium paradoxum]
MASKSSEAAPNLKIVFNRAKHGNALTTSMISHLTELFESAQSDPSITRIALAAHGTFFCTGMDLGKGISPVAQGGDEADAQYSRLKRLFEAIDNAPQVTIACLQGPAFAGGVGLAFACDIRLMTTTASIRLSEVRIGLAAATISKYVIRELGAAFAREAMLSARMVTAQELFRLGKVATVIEDSIDPQAAVDDYLVRLRQCAPRASTLTKVLVRLSWLEGGGGEKQEIGIRQVFDEMMADDSESKYGLHQFQSKAKECDWDAYTLSKTRNKARL